MYHKIPGFQRYGISKEGKLVDLTTHETIPWHKSNGYVFVKILDDHGNPVSIGQHRALALTFLPKPDVSVPITVNHKDGNKSNNDLGNLEWTTYGENTMHAYQSGLRRDCVPAVARNTETGEILEFFSKGQVSRTFGVPRPLLVGRFYTIGCWTIEFLTELFVPQKVDKYPTGLIVRNIHTGLQALFRNETEASRFTGIHPKVIVRIVRDQRFEFPTNGYDIRVFETDLEWPTYTEEELAAFKDQGFIHRPLWITGKGFRKLFHSVKAAAQFTGYNQRHIRHLLNNGLKCGKGFSYADHRRAVEKQ